MRMLMLGAWVVAEARLWREQRPLPRVSNGPMDMGCEGDWGIRYAQYNGTASDIEDLESLIQPGPVARHALLWQLTST